MLQATIIRKDDKNWSLFCDMEGFEHEVECNINHPYFKVGILVSKQGNAIARIACYINPWHLVDGNQALTIGNFECVNDQDVFNFLVSEVIQFAKDNAIAVIIGPMNGSTWDNYRFASSPQKDPFLLEPVTKAYHSTLFKTFGFQLLASYYSQQTALLIDNWETLKDKYEHFLSLGISFDVFNKADAKKEFDSLSDFCNSAFQNNFLFSPISTASFTEKMMATLPLIDSRFTILARFRGKIVGFMFSYQDRLDTQNKTLVIKTLARDLDPKFEGMGSVLSSLVMRHAIKEGYEKCIHALMFDKNTSNFISSKFKGSSLRTYELLKFTIT